MTDIDLDEALRRSGFPREPDHTPDGPADEKLPSIILYGDVEPEPPPMLIEGMLPQTQVAFIAGQFGTAKTFVGVDVAVSCSTGLDFADRKVLRPGGVLWLAAEGKNEIAHRVRCALIDRLPDEPERRIPFAWQAFDVPTLTGEDALERLMELVSEAATTFRERFGEATDLVAIIVDTVGSAAGFADGNSAAEVQRVMNMLRRVSDASGALVILIDHYGKMVETGIMGSSAKAQSADAILAATSIRDAAGNHSDRKISVVKLRGGPSGDVYKFELKTIQVPGSVKPGCAVEWAPAISNMKVPEAKTKPTWTGTSRVLKAAVERAMIEHSQTVRPWGADQTERKAVEQQHVRTEFYASYPAETQEAKRQQFKRLLDRAVASDLVASREIAGTDWVWLVKADDASHPDT